MGDLFTAMGELADLYRQVDWAATPLGPVEQWSPTLAAAVRLTGRSQAAMTLLWGPEYVLLYNHAYAPLVEHQHPSAVGRPAREVFPEVWDDIRPLLERVSGDSGPIWIEDARLPLIRRGRLQEFYFTFSYSPVTGPDGTIEGVLDVVGDTTAQVVGLRRLELLGRLTDRIADLTELSEVRDRALEVLRAARHDFADVQLTLPGVHGSTTAEVTEAAPGRDLVITGDGDDRIASVRLVTDRPSHDGALRAHLNAQVVADDSLQEFVRLIAATLAQALSRISARRSERRSAEQERAMSETLQRSLLTEPIQPDHLQVAVRYQPAVEQAQVGGDWYDSFLVPDGCLTVVVGDVAGHERHSAAAMAQVRSLTRGIAFTLQKPPALVLTRVDAAMTGLAVGAFATAVLAQVEQNEAEADQGVRTLRWSNAGHPPPLLLQPDGTVEVLQTKAETMLGTRWNISRSDHTATLHPGSSVILYTDGLVERRDRPLDDGIAGLVAALTGHQHLSAEQLCDLLLARFGHTTDDDIVLAVIHAYPEDRPRPGKAGPSVLPADLATDHIDGQKT